MRYSKRLTSLTSHIVFVFVGLAGLSETIANWWHNPWVKFGICPLVLLYLLGGTLGWTNVQKSSRHQKVYYITMVVMGSGIMYIANRVQQEGLSAAIIVLPLVMHGAVLERRSRLRFLSAIVGGLFVSLLVGGVHVEDALAFAAALSGILAFDFVGRVIVSEESAHEQLALYAGEVEELSTMRERTRLARDIHDHLGHYLTAINIQAQAAQAILSVDPKQANNALAHIQNLAHEGLQEVRKSINALRALPMDNRLLHEAIKVLVSEVESRDLDVDFQVIGAPVPSAAEVEITIYRVVQETLTNILKHAHAKHATVTLRYTEAPQLLAIHICDDGIGAKSTEGGFGLLGLRERVHLLGGKFQIKTSPNEGFCIEVELAR